jgi:hypothetical protein
MASQGSGLTPGISRSLYRQTRTKVLNNDLEDVFRSGTHSFMLRWLDPRAFDALLEYTRSSKGLFDWLFYSIHLRQVFGKTRLSALTRVKTDGKGGF